MDGGQTKSGAKAYGNSSVRGFTHSQFGVSLLFADTNQQSVHVSINVVGDETLVAVAGKVPGGCGSG